MALGPFVAPLPTPTGTPADDHANKINNAITEIRDALEAGITEDALELQSALSAQGLPITNAAYLGAVSSASAPVDPGSAVLYVKSGDWYAKDASGNEVRLTSGGAIANPTVNVHHSSYWYSPIFTTASVSSTRGPTNDQCRALYMGRAPSALTSIGVRWQQVAGGTFTYAEWGVATGTLTPGSNSTLTLRGYVSASAQWSSPGTYSLSIPVTGDPIAAGSDIWVCYSVSFSAGTPTIRVSSLADPIDVRAMQLRAATRISTNLNTPLAFSDDAATPAWVAFYI